MTTLFPTACNGCTHVRKPSSPKLSRVIANLTFIPGGGMPVSENRTLWPVGGGAVALQPGWFQGHATAFFYINLGDGTIPLNMSLPMQPVFQIVGPTREPYPGSLCLPQVPLPANYTAVVGNNATIQVVETAVHGAALYNVSLLAKIFRISPNEIPCPVRGHHLCQPRRRP